MFARLVPRSSTANTIAEMMQEMVKVYTGNITTAGQLTAFDSSKSYIITTTPTNWSLIYPSVVTSNSNVYIMRSLCVDTNKYKYARIICKGTATNEPWVEPTGGTANPNQQRTYTNRYIEIDSCTSVNTTTATVTNSTYKHQGAEGYVPFSRDLVLSASNTHLAMYSLYDLTSNFVPLFGVFEYPETNITTSQNLIPVVTYRGRGSGLRLLTTALETGPASGNSVVQIPDGYNAVTNTKSLQTIDANTSPFSFDFSTTYTSAAQPGDRHASQTNTYARQISGKDLFFYDMFRSHNFINATTLTNVAYIPNQNSVSQMSQSTVDATTYTYTGNTYCALPLVSSIILFPET